MVFASFHSFVAFAMIQNCAAFFDIQSCTSLQFLKNDFVWALHNAAGGRLPFDSAKDLLGCFLTVRIITSPARLEIAFQMLDRLGWKRLVESIHDLSQLRAGISSR